MSPRLLVFEICTISKGDPVQLKAWLPDNFLCCFDGKTCVGGEYQCWHAFPHQHHLFHIILPLTLNCMYLCIFNYDCLQLTGSHHFFFSQRHTGSPAWWWRWWWRWWWWWWWRLWWWRWWYWYIILRLLEIHLWIDQLVQISRDIANQLHHRLQQVAHLGLVSSELKKANLDMAISQHQPLWRDRPVGRLRVLHVFVDDLGASWIRSHFQNKFKNWDQMDAPLIKDNISRHLGGGGR